MDEMTEQSLLETAKEIFDSTNDEKIKDQLSPYVSSSIDSKIRHLVHLRLRIFYMDGPYHVNSQFENLEHEKEKYNKELNTWPEVIKQYEEILKLLKLSKNVV